jgi:hypothetical protein
MTEMGKKQSVRRDQPEFMFVFNTTQGNCEGSAQTTRSESSQSNQRSNLDADEAKLVRRKLIDELREFGC